MASAGADRPEQGRLARALRHDDREGVVDDERRHDQSDHAEHGHDRREDPDELGHLIGVLLGPLLAGDHLLVGHGLRDRRCELLLGLALDRAHGDVAVLAGGSRQFLGHGIGEVQRSGGGFRGAVVAQAQRADEGEAAVLLLADHIDGVAEGPTVVGHGPEVHGDLVVGLGTPALGDDSGPDRIVDPVEDQGGRTESAAGDLAVRPHDLHGGRFDDPVGRAHAICSAHLVDEFAVDGRAELSEGRLLYVRGTNDRVVALVDVGEQPVDRVVEHRTEDLGSGEERDAEDHRDTGGDESALARHEVFESYA